MGAKTKKQFSKICRKTQAQLKNGLAMAMKERYDVVIEADGFIFAKGTVPILLVAHMDTVHATEPTEIICEDNKISSPQGIGGDDRCGIYMIKQIIKRHHCSVLFTEDEEIGCVGAEKFINHPIANHLKFNYIVELDRRGNNDAVFYDCDNPEFTEFVCRYGWEDAWGSFTDISTVAPFLGVAAVNFSCGYYNAHTTDEYVMLDEMENNIERVCMMIEDTTENDVFEYIEAKSSVYYRMMYGSKKANSLSCYGGWDMYPDDDMPPYDLDYSCGGYTSSDMSKYGITPEDNYYTKFLWSIDYVNELNSVEYSELYAENQWAAIGRFLAAHPMLSFGDIIEIECLGDDSYNL